MDSNKKEILESLEKHKGIVTTACASIGLARSTYYHWLEDDKEFKAAVAEIQEATIDFVESKLMQLIESKDVTSTIFFLKTRGRKRGYNERVLIGEDDEHPLPQVILFQLPDNGRNPD